MGNSGVRQHYDTASKTGVLQLSDCKYREIPIEVFNISDKLRNLDLSKNKISILPDDISRLKKLKQLNLDSNKLEVLPNSFGSMNKLEIVNISNNMISVLPQSFANLSNLKQLYLNYNNLTVFPKQLFKLRHLEVVELPNNKITEIPCGMSDFYAVELNISQNELSVIGDDLHKAPRLKILRLEENCLTLDQIRTSLFRDSKIHTINLDGNLFELKHLFSMEGYNEYSERYTEMKKKMF